MIGKRQKILICKHCLFKKQSVWGLRSGVIIMQVIDDDDDDDFDDDERQKSKKNNIVSNDRSGHDDQNAY